MKVKDIVEALDCITGGRVAKDVSDLFGGNGRFVLIKSSNIPGKAVVETPGLVFGDPEAEVKEIAVTMTLTEGSIELAAATGVNVIVSHHPIADAANSGGVPLKSYLSLYGISVIEVHEAFHGLHPGISYIHGHKPFRVDIKYGGIPGNIVYFGKALDEVKTLGDIINRVKTMMDIEKETLVLDEEKGIYECSDINESAIASQGEIILGTPDSKVNTIFHVFPHNNLYPEHIVQAKKEYPEIDTVLATISRARKGSELIKVAEDLGLNFICGNSHAMEIFENGLPLAYALRHYLSEEVVINIFRQKVYSMPLSYFGSDEIKKYAQHIAKNYLIKC